MTTKRQNSLALLAILHDHAPNGIAQKLCSEIYREALLTKQNVELILVETLYDGLAYGNWPWKIEVINLTGG